MAENNLFQRLTKLFRSGPVVKRKVRAYKQPDVSTANDVFKKSISNVYSTAMSAYGSYDRMARYSDYSEMEYTPEIASALDIYAEETTASDDKGVSLHIYSENRQIKTILNDLFYDTLNIEFNLTPWVRDLVKYGDLFLFNDVSTHYGVQNVFPIPVNEIEREEGFDPQDPLAVRFRWVTQGNTTLENWQITHIRLLGNDAFLPYGSSILESARRIWRQLILIEDAMLVYRVVRSPERRVFYIDVANVPAEEIQNYMEQAKAILRSNSVIDQSTGRVDLRYNPLSVDEDYFIPMRGEASTRIETLAGGTNVTAIEDVEYIQKKLFSALKVPKAYLGYDEMLGSKATLSQEDIRFSRTVARIQKTIISELNKLAIIHLYAHGFEGEDLLDFELKLSNPSTIAQQQKLELFRTKFEIAASAPEGVVDRNWVQKNVMGLSDDEIDRIERGRFRDRKLDMQIEEVGEAEGGDDGGFGGGGGFGGAGGGGDFGDEDFGDEDFGDEGGDLDIGDEDLDIGDGEDLEFGSDDDNLEDSQARKRGKLLSSLNEEDDEEDEEIDFSPSSDDAPIKAQSLIDKTIRNRKRRRTSGAEALSMPDFNRMVGSQRPGDSINDPYDKNSVVGDPFKEWAENPVADFLDAGIKHQARMTSRMEATLNSLDKSIFTKGRSRTQSLLSESDDAELELDLDLKLEDSILPGDFEE